MISHLHETVTCLGIHNIIYGSRKDSSVPYCASLHSIVGFIYDRKDSDPKSTMRSMRSQVSLPDYSWSRYPLWNVSESSTSLYFYKGAFILQIYRRVDVIEWVPLELRWKHWTAGRQILSKGNWKRSNRLWEFFTKLNWDLHRDIKTNNNLCFFNLTWLDNLMTWGDGGAF